MNHYQTLGIKQTASLDEIKRAFKNLALKYHPDRNNGDKLAEEKFKQINEAYKTLSRLSSRKTYDIQNQLVKQGEGIEYVYHQGGFYRSIFPRKPLVSTNYPPKDIFKSKKKDIDFYLFWITLGMIFILVSVLIFKL